MAKMSIREKLLKDIMSSGLKIPPYQRDASWAWDKTVRLWESISEYVQTKDSSKSDHNFYLGNLVTHKHFSLVDGQQRMNALTIISCSLRDVLLYMRKTDKAYDVHQYLICKDRKVTYNLNEKNILSTAAMNAIRKPRIRAELGVKVSSHTVGAATGNWTEVEVSTKGRTQWTLSKGDTIFISNFEAKVSEIIHHNKKNPTFGIKVHKLDNPADLDGEQVEFGGDVPDLPDHPTCDSYLRISGMFFHQFENIVCQSTWKKKTIKKDKEDQLRFSIPNGWKTPSIIPLGTKLEVTTKGGKKYSIEQTKSNRSRGNAVYNIYVRYSTDTELEGGTVEIARDDTYTKLDEILLLDVNKHIKRYVDVLWGIKFGVTNFTEYSNALEHFTLANDGTRMEKLYDHDLFHAMTHKFVDQLKAQHKSESDQINSLWNEEISPIICPPDIDRYESLKKSRQFFGWYCLSKGFLNGDKRYEWTKMGKTDIFAGLEKFLKYDSGKVTGGIAGPSIVDFYKELSRHAFFAKVADDPVRTIKEDSSGADEYLSYEARALISTLKQLTPEIFSPLIMSLLRELDNESVSDRSDTIINCIKKICHYLLRYWVVSGIQKEDEEDRMVLTQQNIYQMYENKENGWSMHIQNISDPTTELVDLVEAPFKAWVKSRGDLGETAPDWPMKKTDSNLNIKKHTTSGSFFLHCYQYHHTKVNKMRARFLIPKPKNKKDYADDADHAEVEHILPQNENVATGKDDTGADAWPHLKTVHEDNFRKLGNLCLLEYHINRSYSRKGWESVKFHPTDGGLNTSDFYKEQFRGYSYVKWDEDAISERSWRIVRDVCKGFSA